MTLTQRQRREITSWTILAFSLGMVGFGALLPASSQEADFSQGRVLSWPAGESFASPGVPALGKGGEEEAGEEFLPSGPEPVPRLERIKILGSTVFSAGQLAAVVAPFRGKEATLENLLALRAAVTQLYVEQGYFTSAAFLPAEQELSGGMVQIQVVEGKLEEIDIQGLQRLNPRYLRERMRLGVPLNLQQLEADLQRLQADPLIASISAELGAGSSPGLSVLTVKVTEADTFTLQVGADNSRSPTVGSERRGILLREANLLGGGEQIEAGYFNSDGSDSFSLRLAAPVNASNGTVRLDYERTDNEIVEAPFNRLDLETQSRYYGLTFRQPILQTPWQEIGLGLILSHVESRAFLEGMPFPLSRGSDERGRTRITAVRFFQDWTARSERDILSLRSQFSWGLEALEATVGLEPDAEFFNWSGQGQWVRLLAADTLLVVRGELQLSSQPLLPDEQFRLGGFDTVRGYRQDWLLSDNGFFASAEVQLPVLRVPQWQAVLQVAPFVDVGTGWNNGDFPLDPPTLASVGLGLRWQQGENFHCP